MEIAMLGELGMRKRGQQVNGLLNIHDNISDVGKRI